MSDKNNANAISKPGNPTNTYQYIFKVILIGNAGTGKTSLIHRFVNKVFADKYICTIGVDFFMKTFEIDKTIIKLQIWDTAGMEKYKTIAASYFRGSHAAFVVFDLTDRSSFDGVQKWLDEYNKQNNPIFKRMVVLIGNKNDLVDNRAVSKEEIEIFSKNNDMFYWETSAKDGKGVEEAFLFVGQKLFEFYRTSINDQVKDSIVITKTNNTLRNYTSVLDNGVAGTRPKEKKCCF